MSKRFKSFTVRLTIPILMYTTGLFVVTLIVVAIFVDGILTREAVRKSNTSLETAILYTNSSINEIESLIENSQFLVQLNRDDTSTYKYITRKIINDNPGVVGSIIALVPEKNNGLHYAGYSKRIDDSKKTEYNNISTDSYDYTTMDWYQIPILLDKPMWSEPYYDDGGADATVSTYSFPIKDSTGQIYAILTADLSIQWLTQKASSIKPYEKSCNFIISKGGLYVSTNDSMILKNHMNETLFTQFFENQDSSLFKAAKRMVHGIRDDFEFIYHDVESYASYGPLCNDWSMMIISFYYDVFEPNVTINVLLFFIAFVGLLLLSIICIRLIRSKTKPIHDFALILDKIAKDNYDNSIPVIKANDEILSLRNAIERLQFTLKENRSIRNDLESAKYIQSSILPAQSLKRENFELFARLDPAKEVGGDLYDYYYSENKHSIHFMVGDVAGKGVPAALIMSMVVSVVKLISKLGLTDSKVVSSINNLLAKDNITDSFVTLFFGSINMDTYNMSFCNAGHNPPIIIPPFGDPFFLQMKSNIVMGAVCDYPYQTESIQLVKGSMILIYSDGVSEAERKDKVQYGDERLLQWAKAIQKNIDFLSSENAVNYLREDVRDFVEGKKYTKDPDLLEELYPQNDDITIMMVKI